MLSFKSIHFITAVCARHFHSSLGSSSNIKGVMKAANVMNKLMNAKGKSKKKWYEPPENTLPTMNKLAKTHMIGKIGVKRMTMLNKMFMKNITDLLCTGSLSAEILGKGLEISKVDITPNFRTLRVYWVCSIPEQAKEMEDILTNTAGVLRRELSEMRCMGQVPIIVFVKDEHETRIQEIDERLLKADYGKDFQPKTMGQMLKTDFTLPAKLTDEVMARIQQIEAESLDSHDVPVPEMTHNMYGLDHLTMTNRMLASRKTSEDAWNRLTEPGVTRRENVVSYSKTETGAPKQDYAEDSRNLADFLHRRQIEQNRLYKEAWSRDAERNVVFELEGDEVNACVEQVDDFGDEFEDMFGEDSEKFESAEFECDEEQYR